MFPRCLISTDLKSLLSVWSDILKIPPSVRDAGEGGFLNEEAVSSKSLPTLEFSRIRVF